MTLYLACVAYVISGGLNPFVSATDTVTLEYPSRNSLAFSLPPERKDAATQSCAMHKTFKDAALSAYRKEQLDATLTIYEVNTDTLTVKPLPRPTVRLEVEEGR